MQSKFVIILAAVSMLCFQNRIDHHIDEKGMWANADSLYNAMQSSQFEALNSITNDSLKSESSRLVVNKWYCADTFRLKCLSREIWRLHNTHQCSDSLLIVELPIHGEVDFTKYIIADLKKRIKLTITIITEAKTTIKDSCDLSTADSIMVSRFIPRTPACVVAPLAPFTNEACFYFSSSTVQSALCFGSDNKDYGWVLHLNLGRKI